MKQVIEILTEIINMDRKDTVKVIHALTRLVMAERERCANEVSAEAELEGTMPDENWVMSKKVNLENHLRATVKVAKRNILERIMNPGNKEKV